LHILPEIVAHFTSDIMFVLQATLQIGGHGERLVQCREVRLTTGKPIPMQVDGEPCRLAPSVIRISLR